MNHQEFDITKLFQHILEALRRERANLNLADERNHNHGDHMVAIFEVAVQATEKRSDAGLADQIEYAAGELGALQENGSALVYQRGLHLLAEQFRKRNIDLDTLLPYVRSASQEKANTAGEQEPARSAEVLKALLAALAAWENDELPSKDGSDAKTADLDLGYLMGMGIAFMQAKQKGGNRLDVLAETAASATPLSRVPHRQRSGVLVLRTLLAVITEAGETPA